MTEQEKASWEQCKGYIKQQVGEVEYTTWFSALSFLAFREGTLHVTVPTSYVREYIEKTHLTVLGQSIMMAFGKGTKLLYHYPSAVEDEPTVPELAENKGKQEDEKAQKTADEDGWISNLHPEYAFSNFIEGEANKLALTVAKSIAEKPEQITFNPFFLFGPSGVGKTHLINAIGLALRESRPEKRVLYVSANLFQQQFVAASLANKVPDFISFYQSIKVLIVDDVQELQTKKTQETFFHIFDHLHRNNCQLIFASDRPPVELEGFEDRLITRFKWGITAEIERPDIILRRAILLSKTRRNGISVFSDDIIEFIARNVNDNVRNIEGVIDSLLMYSIVYGNCDIDVALAERVIARTVNLDSRTITPEQIVDKVCKHFKVKVTLLNGATRKREVVQARQIAMYLCHKHTELSLSQIGKRIGKRDHSTVMHSCKMVEQNLATDQNFRRVLEAIEAVLLNNK